LEHTDLAYTIGLGRSDQKLRVLYLLSSAEPEPCIKRCHNSYRLNVWFNATFRFSLTKYMLRL